MYNILTFEGAEIWKRDMCTRGAPARSKLIITVNPIGLGRGEGECMER